MSITVIDVLPAGDADAAEFARREVAAARA